MRRPWPPPRWRSRRSPAVCRSAFAGALGVLALSSLFTTLQPWFLTVATLAAGRGGTSMLPRPERPAGAGAAASASPSSASRRPFVLLVLLFPQSVAGGSRTTSCEGALPGAGGRSSSCCSLPRASGSRRQARRPRGSRHSPRCTASTALKAEFNREAAKMRVIILARAHLPVLPEGRLRDRAHPERSIADTRWSSSTSGSRSLPPIGDSPAPVRSAPALRRAGAPVLGRRSPRGARARAVVRGARCSSRPAVFRAASGGISSRCFRRRGMARHAPRAGAARRHGRRGGAGVRHAAGVEVTAWSPHWRSSCGKRDPIPSWRATRIDPVAFLRRGDTAVWRPLGGTGPGHRQTLRRSSGPISADLPSPAL